MTSKRSRPLVIGDATSSAGDSPVSPPAASDGEPGQQTSAGCGQSSPVLFASYDPATSSWRTPQGCLMGGLTEFSGTWPTSGMMRNGSAYLLQPLVLPMFGIGCGLVPTPGANDWKGSSKPGQRRGQLDEWAENLPAWGPCPCCENYLCMIHGQHAHDCPCPEIAEWKTDPYTQRVSGWRLSPPLSEWLMGFPPGWTDCEP